MKSHWAWDVADVIPGWWPQDPHLVHEIAILADRCRRGGFTMDRRPARPVVIALRRRSARTRWSVE